MPAALASQQHIIWGFSVVRQETERWGEAIATARIRLE